jgi:hypothetical protein
MAQKNFTGWAEYRRREKTPPAHAVGSSRVGPAPHSPRKVAGDSILFKTDFCIRRMTWAVFWGGGSFSQNWNGF